MPLKDEGEIIPPGVWHGLSFKSQNLQPNIIPGNLPGNQFPRIPGLSTVYGYGAARLSVYVMTSGAGFNGPVAHQGFGASDDGRLLPVAAFVPKPGASLEARPQVVLPVI
jgi:hypothetical protein